MTPRPKRIASALVAALAAVTMLGAGSAAAKTPPPTPAPVKIEITSTKDTSDNDLGGQLYSRSFKPRR